MSRKSKEMSITASQLPLGVHVYLKFQKKVRRGTFNRALKMTPGATPQSMWISNGYEADLQVEPGHDAFAVARDFCAALAIVGIMKVNLHDFTFECQFGLGQPVSSFGPDDPAPAFPQPELVEELGTLAGDIAIG
jgi:hypothetical protein